MSRLTLQDFGGGLDLRRGATVAKQNTFRLLDDCWVQAGGQRLAKRNGFDRYDTLAADSRGLAQLAGKLYTFVAREAVNVSAAGIQEVTIQFPEQPTAVLREVLFAEEFRGKIYVAAAWQLPSGGVRIVHHYAYVYSEGGSQAVMDVNCPHTSRVVITAGKVFAASAEVLGNVSFSATLDATDWTSPKNAGFIACGDQRVGSKVITALDVYREYLTVFFIDGGIQLWQVDADPANIKLVRQIDAASTPFARGTVASSGDLYYLSRGGVRAVSTATNNEQQYEYDVGSAVDALAQPLLLAAGYDPNAVPNIVVVPASGGTP